MSALPLLVMLALSAPFLQSPILVRMMATCFTVSLLMLVVLTLAAWLI